MSAATIDEKKRLSFSLGFLLAMAGAVITATSLYGNLQSDNKALKEQVAELRQNYTAQSEVLAELKLQFALFVAKYDQDMNRYVRDRRETTAIR